MAQNCRLLGTIVFSGLLLCACSAVPPVEHQPSRPKIEDQPLPIVPDLPPVALQTSENAPKPTAAVSATATQPTVADNDSSIFFQPRKTSIDDDEKEKLKPCANQLKQNSKQVVLLIGYSDGLGSKSYNLAIAEQRISAVSAALRSLGVERGQIRRNRSNSVKKVAYACRAEECRRQMRRVEFICGA